MESPKRTHKIGIVVNDDVFDLIKSISEKQKWTLSSTVNNIIEQFLMDKNEIRL